ncbi:MAG: DUF4115 domain-containing protein [Pasteurellaceae bacterium]|nr:DUF4115 domain-containing protein [Pasteurellaceae bacterium]
MTENESTILSLGQQLQHARQALGLSLEQVAEKTNLKKNHLDALEQDIFILPNVPPAFVRGYVRGYLRFLCLPEELGNRANYGEVSIPNEVKRTASIPVANNHKSQTRWVKVLTWLVLLATVGMTLAWWWQEYKKEQASSEQLVSHVQPEQGAAVGEPMVKNHESVPMVISVEQTQERETVTSETVQTSAQNVMSENETAEPILLDTSAPQPVQVNILQTLVTESEKEKEATVETPPVIHDELRIEITQAQSWITVRGEKNKKLAEKLYNEGEVLTFNGNEQYRLTVGAPANVKIYYKGELVPLKVDGRVARFKLPLAN